MGLVLRGEYHRYEYTISSDLAQKYSQELYMKQALVKTDVTSPRETAENMTFCILDLQRHMPLFRDAAAFATFVSLVLEKAADHGTTILSVGEQPIGRLTTAAGARQMFQLLIASRLTSEPSLLSDIQERIEDEEFEKEGTFEIANE